jgi:hypothetical protein
MISGSPSGDLESYLVPADPVEKVLRDGNEFL